MYDDLRRSSGACSELAGKLVRFPAPGRQGDHRPDPRINRLLACLPEADHQQILPALEGLSLPQGLALYEAGDPQRYVYFPTSSIVSLHYVFKDGASAEFAVAGNEGLVGLSHFGCCETSPYRAVVLSAGYAYRLRSAVLKKEFERSEVLRQLLLRYTQALMTQMAQIAVCNRHHALEQQLCRWLLLSLDRLPSNQFTMTHELIANMLGVRREGVTETAGKLQARGIVHFSRGHITVLDRAKLEASVCECYAVVRREYDRLIPARLVA